MPDINDYINIPFKPGGRDLSGCDCYGLFRILYHDFKGVELPVFDDVGDRAAINSLILEHQKSWQEVFDPEFGDMICFRVLGLVTHIGMMIDKINFIHAMRGTFSCIEDVNSIRWRRRIDGYFRYIG